MNVFKVGDTIVSEKFKHYAIDGDFGHSLYSLINLKTKYKILLSFRSNESDGDRFIAKSTIISNKVLLLEKDYKF